MAGFCFNAVLERFSRKYRKVMGSFHYAKDSGNFGPQSNAKVRFGYSDRNLPFHFDKLVHCPSSLHLCRESNKNGKSHSSWLARFDRKVSFHFPQVFPLISDRSLWP